MNRATAVLAVVVFAGAAAQAARAQTREIPSPDGPILTGIYKEPVQGRVMLRALDLEGDGQADLQNHGGVYQAAKNSNSD